MYEVELKVRAAHEDVRPELESAGATLQEVVDQRDVYFDAPHRDFAARDEALRLREETGSDGKETFLTYKGPRLNGNSKTRTEHETTVGAPTELEQGLTALGFEPAATVQKHRERYELDSFAVVLDSVEELGEFVEIETTATGDAVDQAQKAVAKKAERLGLDPDKQISTSYLELLCSGSAEC